jgi:pyruvate/2-oxoglutarate dehydrogenase complex dihydrolipoamide acyltransferase (E2) component
MSMDRQAEFMIGPAGDPAQADLHLLYTGNESFQGHILTGGDTLPPRTFAMYYGEGWVEIGREEAGAAYGNAFVLRHARSDGDMIVWIFDHGLAPGDAARLWLKLDSGWSHTLDLVCVRKKTPPPSKQEEQPAKEPAPKPKPAETKPPPQKEKAARDLVEFSSVGKQNGTLTVTLTGTGVKEGTVLFGDLVAEDGEVLRTVPVLMPAERKATMRFAEPFPGWTPGTYIVRVRMDDKVIKRGSVDLP